MHNSGSCTSKYIWSTKGIDYLLKGNNRQCILKLIDTSTIKMIITDMSQKNIEVYYTKTNNSTTNLIDKVVPIATSFTTMPVTKKVTHSMTKSTIRDTQKPTVVKTKALQHITMAHTIAGIKNKPSLDKESIVNIDIATEKAEKKRKLDREYLQATLDVMYLISILWL